MTRRRRVVVLALASLLVAGAGVGAAPAAVASTAAAPAVNVAPAAHVAVDILGCKDSPTPEVPGRGVVGFFESTPDTPPPAGDPFAAHPTTTIYEQYGYAGLRWNTYDLGCGPDIARAPDATVGTAVANWIVALPKAAVAATGAVIGAAFSPDFLGVFDPMIDQVVQALRRTVFDQWAFLVVAALGLLLIWRARQASLASSAAAIGWALLVMVLVTMVFRWPLVAGHAADETVTSTLAAVTGGLNDGAPGTTSTDSNHGDAALGAISGMQEALLYQAWLGGTFGSTNSAVAKEYGPTIFASQALTWQQAQVLRTDPDAGKKIIDAKEKTFEDTAAKIKAQDPDAYDYLTGQRSDSRVGYAVLAGIATLCAVPFLFVAGLLVLGALVIVRFGVMLFPLFATLGLFPTMRQLVTGVASTVAAALINAVIFGIGAAVTVRGMGILLAPSAAVPPWLAIVLMLLLTIVMWVALRPFRRLTVMVSSSRNHFAAGAGGVSGVTRSAARAGSRVLTTALGTFLGVSAARRRDGDAQPARGAPSRSGSRRRGPTTRPRPATPHRRRRPPWPARWRSPPARRRWRRPWRRAGRPGRPRPEHQHPRRHRHRHRYPHRHRRTGSGGGGRAGGVQRRWQPGRGAVRRRLGSRAHPGRLGPAAGACRGLARRPAAGRRRPGRRVPARGPGRRPFRAGPARGLSVLGRAVVWLCRSPQRLAGSVVALLAVVLLGGGALFGGFGAAPSRPAPSTAPSPTAAQVPDAAPYVSAALSFVQVWSALRPGETASQWQDALIPLATTRFAAQLRTTDPAGLPGVQAQGEPVVRFVASSSALVAVPLADGSTVLVSVVSEGSGQKVSNVQPDVGD